MRAFLQVFAGILMAIGIVVAVFSFGNVGQRPGDFLGAIGLVLLSGLLLMLCEISGQLGKFLQAFKDSQPTPAAIAPEPGSKQTAFQEVRTFSKSGKTAIWITLGLGVALVIVMAVSIYH